MDERLEQVLERARRSPFYSRRLPTGASWESVAITTKEDLRNQYPFGLLAVDRSKIVSYHESSGTKGRPTSSYFTSADWEDIAIRFLRNAVGLSSKDTFFIKTPYSMVTTAHQAHRAAEIIGALIVPGDNRSSNMPYSRVVQVLRDLRISVSWSLPTEVLIWAIAARECGIDPERDFPNLRAFWVAGELLSPGKRTALSSLWGGKAIFEDYGSTETGSLAGEMPCGHVHPWSDRLLFEVLLSGGEIAQAGRGRLLVTPYFREAMPLVRYLVDDEVEISSSPCGFPTIKVFGRASEKIQIAGRSFFPLEIEDAVYQTGRELGLVFWKGQFNSDSLEIHYFATQGGSLSDGIERRLEIPVKTRRLPLSRFIDAALLREPLRFSKPQFLFPQEGMNHERSNYTIG